MRSSCVVRFNGLRVAVWRLGLLAVFLTAMRANAADTRWRNPDGGTFSIGGNWNNGVPGASDVAHFGLSTTGIFGALPPYTVSFTADATNQALDIEDDSVVFDLNGRVYTTTASVPIQLGTVSNGAGRLTVTDGIVILPFQSDLQIATVSGRAGSLTVTTGGLVLGSPDLFVGLNGNGTLNINSGGDVIASVARIGATVGSTGAATISGASSSLLASELSVGSFGQGTLSVTGGARVEATNARIGSQDDANGLVTVDGTNSKWINTGTLTIAGEGTATLNITGGAQVQNTVGTIAEDVGSNGSVTVDAGSIWTNTGKLNVGFFGEGHLAINFGASVFSAEGGLGVNSVGSVGTASITGPNSQWINSGLLTVGGFGQGTLSVTGDGRVEATNARIGSQDDAIGIVTVDGVNSQWINTGTLTIAGEGTATLNITGGAQVQNTVGTIGEDGGSNGSATVGAGSTWTNSGKLSVGFVGEGQLTINPGASVFSAEGGLGVNSVGSAGTVSLVGPNAQWINSGLLTVGGFGQGTMSVTGGARVEATNARIGSQDDAIGIVTVDGANSLWINTGTLTVADEGAATLNISGGSHVSNSDAFIASDPGGSGTVTINGAGSTWEVGGRLSIGGFDDDIDGGVATVAIQPGSTVQVARNTLVFDSDVLRLEGGTLSTTEIDFPGNGSFQWTSGTLHVGVYHGNLTAPSGGVLAPGNSAGTTQIEGNYSQQIGGTLHVEIGGIAEGAQYDIVNVFGNAALGGNLQLSMLNGFVPNADNSFTIFQATGSITGTFANVNNGQRLTTSDGLGSFLVHYGPNSAFNSKLIVLSAFEAIAIPGDYNQNGIVDAADYTLWRNNLGSGTSLPNDDTPGVGQDDYTRWKTHFGQSLGAAAVTNIGALASIAVPEPSAMWLLFVVLTGWAHSHRAAARILGSDLVC